MRRLALIIIISLFSLIIKAQSKGDYSDVQAIVNDTNKVYSDGARLIEPEFPAGLNAFFEYTSNIAKNLKKIDPEVKGSIFVDVVVEKNGQLFFNHIRGSASKELNKEAVKEVCGMPKWIPGTFEGKPVRVMYTIPIRFN